MFAIVKRILDVAGSFSPASRRSLIVGMVCNVLKAFFMSGMLAAVWWALENRDHMGADVALQCLGILLASVAGQYIFQYLVDIKMDAEGFHIFRDMRLHVGDRLKGAPMGYFSEQRLSAITTTLTTSMAVYAEGSAQDDILWALGLLLMGMSLIFILIIHLIGRKGAKARG